jgi:tetratricopeptide (TPR) repeat protein
MVPPDAGEDLRLAQLHLRLGQLTLARAELEDLASRDALGVEGLAALAEARWRTDAGEPAAAAARDHLEAGGTDPIATCIMAEAAAAAGRPGEARELIGRLGGLDPAHVDALFAGMPQRAAWPVADSGLLAPQREPSQASPGADDREGRAPAAWDSGAELRRAREELGSRPERALVRLALVLRRDPTLAPAVLDAVALRREPIAALIRGDAQRLLGRHLEAEAAFDAAAENLEAM